MKKSLAAIVVCLGVSVPAVASAAWQANPPGLTEFIACGNTQFIPVQWFVDWNDFSFRYFDTLSLGSDPWWTYASPGNQAACAGWVRGSIAGGAGYVPGQVSTPHGRNAHISSYWYDFNTPNFYVQSDCGHQHVLTYVWGWRYFGNAWTIEFVRSTGLSTWWNSATQHCDFKGDGHPDFPPPPQGIPGFAYGNGVVTINNSPYAVLYTMSQAQSHRSAGCGQFGCFHRTLVISSFY